MTKRDPDAGLWKMMWRGMRRRCPRCGHPVFVSYFEMSETCAACGLRFEREEGYWVGAVVINTTVTFGSFLLVFVGGMVVTWPEVPWEWLMALSIGVCLLLPIAFYPQSKMVWSALELSWHRLEPDEISAAAQRLEK